MAKTDRDRTQPRAGETSEIEHDRIRSSNDRDQEAEREGIDSEHNRGYDDAVRGNSSEEIFEDVDPDSARSDIDRDDTIDEP
ncbi:hypothetical protein D3C83_15390 [compost metagenome]